MFKIILLGVSVCIDSWAVGSSYQAADIKIPARTKAIIALISALSALAALLLGQQVTDYVDVRWIQMLGGLVLAILGGKSLWKIYSQKEEKNYDADASQSIDGREGVLLGCVLASDSFCAALSLCGSGDENYLFPMIVGALTYGFFVLADKKVKGQKICDYFAGGILVVIGAIQVMGI